ncbi:MAG: acylphosphatase [Phycisphaeraceae bacterium]|nr:acylphosphatase [Phycisphaeraceae bacterium]MCW5762331.1 acylphosphatase [Phycisphaeraceae bacterium]
MDRIGVTYSGLVQGVGFRATVRSLARPFQVSGWVRNEPDGTVRLEVQGVAEEVERFLASVVQERGSFITRARREALPIVEDESGFVIAY